MPQTAAVCLGTVAVNEISLRRRAAVGEERGGAGHVGTAVVFAVVQQHLRLIPLVLPGTAGTTQQG